MTSTTVHVLGKCPAKGCANRRRNTIADAPVRRYGRHTYTAWQIPAPEPYGQVFAHLHKKSDRHAGWGNHPRPSAFLHSHTRPQDVAWFIAVRDAGWICTEHDRFMVTVEVKGNVNATKPCTAACRAATSAICDCVCGGEFHGANWGLR
jgi:hypothetical protein